MIRKKFFGGQGLIEYLLLVALVAASGMMALSATGSSVAELYCRAATSLGSGNACSGSYFFDDFEDISEWDNVSGNWSTEGGQVCAGPGEGKLAVDVDATDYVVNLSGADLSQGDGFGIFFRTSDHENMNGYSFQFDPGYGGGEFILRKWANGYEFSPFAREKAYDFDWYGKPYDIQIVARGDTFEVYVDDVLAVSGSDPTYSEGGVGLRIWDGTKACFDEISVDPLP